MTDHPERYYTLPTDFAAALGHTVAGFGWLEEVMKRTIFALDRARLAKDLNNVEMLHWLRSMDEIASDSMGTLIEQLDSTLRRHPGIDGRLELNSRLIETRRNRNLLCHASWQPGKSEDSWHPAFVNSKGEVFTEEFTTERLRAVLDETRQIGQRLIRIMHSTGIHGRWPGDDDL